MHLWLLTTALQNDKREIIISEKFAFDAGIIRLNNPFKMSFHIMSEIIITACIEAMTAVKRPRRDHRRPARKVVPLRISKSDG